jgi:histidine ammonia-lyase
VETVQRLRALLDGGALLRGERRPRAMQDPLAFKVVPQTHGAVRDALAHCTAQLRVELASSGDSPIMVPEEDRAICAGNHDITAIAIALDYARLALAQAVTITNERVQKLLDSRFTGLPTGLRADPLAPHDSLGVVGHGAASLAGEARLLAQPVTLEHAGTRPASQSRRTRHRHAAAAHDRSLRDHRRRTPPSSRPRRRGLPAEPATAPRTRAVSGRGARGRLRAHRTHRGAAAHTAQLVM